MSRKNFLFNFFVFPVFPLKVSDRICLYTLLVSLKVGRKYVKDATRAGALKIVDDRRDLCLRRRHSVAARGAHVRLTRQ